MELIRKLFYTGSLIFSFLVLFLFIPAQVSAKVISSESDVTIESGEVIDDDLFIGGETVTFEGTVNGDLYVAGGEIRVDGTVNGDLLAAGGMIQVSGIITDDLRAAGGNLTISEAQIGDNASLAGGNVTIDDNTTIGGSLTFGTGNLVITGKVLRNIVGGGGAVNINGPVSRNVRVGAGQLRFGPKASVAGDVIYSSEEDLKMDKSATIAGQLRQVIPEVGKATKRTVRQIPAVVKDIKIGFKLWAYLAALLVGFIILRLARKPVEEIANTIQSQAWESLGWGFLIFLIAGPAFLLLTITVVGIPLAFILGILFIIEIYLAKIFVGIVMGQLVLDLFRKSQASTYTLLAVGLAVYYVISSVRLIGGLISLATILFALGAIFIYKRKLLASKKN